MALDPEEKNSERLFCSQAIMMMGALGHPASCVKPNLVVAC